MRSKNPFNSLSLAIVLADPKMTNFFLALVKETFIRLQSRRSSPIYLSVSRHDIVQVNLHYQCHLI
jgi:hypothetical protein